MTAWFNTNTGIITINILEANKAAAIKFGIDTHFIEEKTDTQRSIEILGDVKIFRADVEIICGEYSFLDTRLFVCKDLHEAERIANEQVDKENSMYPEETFYKLRSIEEFNYLDSTGVRRKLETSTYLNKGI